MDDQPADDGPTGTESPTAETEAEAQRQATVMPWIFGAAGLLLIAVFIAWLTFGQRAHIREPAAAAPSNPNVRAPHM
jgi:hypothetical protein